MKKAILNGLCVLLCICATLPIMAPLSTIKAQNTPNAADFEARLLLATGQIMLFEYKPKDEKVINAPEQLANIYYEAAQDPELTKIVCKHILDKYHSMHGSAKSAAQVSQISDEARVKFNLLQTMQNAYIIKLLKEKQ